GPFRPFESLAVSREFSELAGAVVDLADLAIRSNRPVEVATFAALDPGHCRTPPPIPDKTAPGHDLHQVHVRRSRTPNPPTPTPSTRRPTQLGAHDPELSIARSPRRHFDAQDRWLAPPRTAPRRPLRSRSRRLRAPAALRASVCAKIGSRRRLFRPFSDPAGATPAESPAEVASARGPPWLSGRGGRQAGRIREASTVGRHR